MAIGYHARAGAKKSISLGSFVSTFNGFGSGDAHNITIGKGVSSTQLLVNNIPNSLMIGFNSTIPTVFVAPATGAGTTGGVGIGTTYIPTGYILAVKGKVIFEEGTVRLSADWPDFVFNANYKLMNYTEKEAYILQNHHLPNMQPAAEMEQNGMDISKTVTGVVQNVEENTLDIIKLYKLVEELKKENQELKKKLEEKTRN